MKAFDIFFLFAFGWGLGNIFTHVGPEWVTALLLGAFGVWMIARVVVLELRLEKYGRK